MKPWHWAGLAALALGVHAESVASTNVPPELETPVRQFLEGQPGLQGQSMRLQRPARTQTLPDCSAPLLISLPKGSRPVGWITLAVRCPQPGGWVRNVQLRVQVLVRHLVAAKSLATGKILEPDDLNWAEADAVQLGPKVAKELESVLGQELRRPLPQGSPLRLNDLRALTVIRQGSKVTVFVRGPGFEIEIEGQALNNAALGGMVQVMVREGTIIPAKVTAPGMALAQ